MRCTPMASGAWRVPSGIRLSQPTCVFKVHPLLVDYLSILQPEDLVHIIVYQRVVGGHQHGDVFLFNDLAEQAQHLAGGAAVQFTGWLVGQDWLGVGIYSPLAWEKLKSDGVDGAHKQFRRQSNVGRRRAGKIGVHRPDLAQRYCTVPTADGAEHEGIRQVIGNQDAV